MATAVIEPRIGILMRQGKKVFYAFTKTGDYLEDSDMATLAAKLEQAEKGVGAFSGLLVSTYRDASGYDCMASGVSSKFKEFILVCNQEPIGPFYPCEKTPALYLAKWKGRVIAVPENVEAKYPKKINTREDCSFEGLCGWMFGGNFVYSSDSRMPGKAPIAVYDRREY